MDDNHSVSISRCLNINKLMNIQNILIDTLVCKVCNQLPFRPYKLNQESIEYYCLQCIEKLPNFIEIKQSIIPPSLLEEKLLEKIEIQCKNSEFGCTKVYYYNEINELYKHELECETLYIKCPWKNCKAKSLNGELNDHLVKCEHAMVICSRCYQQYGRNTENFHDCIPTLFKLIKKLKKTMDRKEETLLKKIESLSNVILTEKTETSRNLDNIREYLEKDMNKRLLSLEGSNQSQIDSHYKVLEDKMRFEQGMKTRLEENISCLKKDYDLLNEKISLDIENKFKCIIEQFHNENNAFLLTYQEKFDSINKELSVLDKKNNIWYLKVSNIENYINELVIEKDKLLEMVTSLKDNSIQEAINKLNNLEEITKSLNNEVSVLIKPAQQSTRDSKKALFSETIRTHPLLKDIIFGRKISLIYKASDNSFSSSKFHELCDGVKNTITVIQSENGNIFGGYTPISWDKSNKGYSKDLSKKGFLFSITNSTKHVQFNHDHKAIYSDSDCGPTFGCGYDLHISNECNNNSNSYSRLGNTYKIKEGIKVETDDSKTYLAGSINFKVIEYEVYKII